MAKRNRKYNKIKKKFGRIGTRFESVYNWFELILIMQIELIMFWIDININKINSIWFNVKFVFANI